MSFLALAITKQINRILADTPAAGEQLRAHAGKRVDLIVGPAHAEVRISAHGECDLVGVSADAADLTVTIPLAILPALARQDASAFAQVAFSGDSELAATIALLARNLRWDLEEDLSQWTGDILAHRAVSGVRATGAWLAEAKDRAGSQVAEYLIHERRAFISRSELETLVRANESLRDAIARAEARLSYLFNSSPPRV